PPESSTENARGAQRPTRARLERVETRVHHGRDRLGQVGLTARDRAEQLLEVERVAGREVRDALEGARCGVRSEHLLAELHAGRERELTDLDLRGAACGPQLGKKLAHLGSAEREHEQGAVAEVPEDGVEQGNRRQVAPLEVVEYDEQRVLAALRGDEVL